MHKLKILHLQLTQQPPSFILYLEKPFGSEYSEHFNSWKKITGSCSPNNYNIIWESNLLGFFPFDHE